MAIEPGRYEAKGAEPITVLERTDVFVRYRRGRRERWTLVPVLSSMLSAEQYRRRSR